MERVSKLSPLALSLLVLSGCGSDSEDKPTPRLSTASSVSTFSVSEQCPNGGVVISSGIDENGNGLLDISEIDTNQTVCNGTQGNNSLVDIVDEAAGANCAAGGVKINSGLDIDNSGTLDQNEVTSSKYVCNGSDGQTSLLAISDEPSGENCANGGQKIEQGLDLDQSNSLSPEEVELSRYICNGEDGAKGSKGEDALQPLISTTELATGSSQCANGGFEASFGIDTNKNGALDADEIADTMLACRSVASTLTAVFSEAPGSNCSAGGAALKSGSDSNQNGLLDSSEVQNTHYVCNADISSYDYPPVIHSVTSKPGISTPNEEITLFVTGSDVNGDVDSISWFDEEGNLIGNGNPATVTAPANIGSHTYVAVVEDLAGHSAVGTVEHFVIPSGIAARDADAVDIGDTSVIIPENIDVPATNVTGDVNGFIFVSGDNQELTGFVIERPAYTNEQSTIEVIANIVNSMSLELPASLVNILQRQANEGAINLDYTLTLTGDALKSLELSTEAISLFGSSVAGGSITNPIAVAATATAVNEYRIRLSVRYNAADSVQVAFAAVSAGTYDLFSTEFNSMADLSNAIPSGATISSNVENFSFTPSNAAPIADFLFVIDNSGSMSEEQTAIAEAAQYFGSALSSSNLDYHIGIITTDSTNLRGGAVLNNDLSAFSSTITAIGTNGSATEQGIYQAEQALLSLAQGDASDGSFVAAGYPRPGASLSIIIMSDEESQYPGAFDTVNNLFTQRDYSVFAIIDPSNPGQYSSLALNTGGATADIGDVTTFPQMIDLIGLSAGVIAAGFELDYAPIPSTISVTVNGQAVPSNENNGWRYDSISNRIVLTGEYIPENSAQLAVAYNYEVPPVLQSITLSLPAGAVYVGSSTQIEATGSWDNGETTTLSAGNWTVSDETIATVTADGQLQAIAEGSITVTYEEAGESASLSVTIEQATLTLNTTFAGSPIAQGESISYYFSLTEETDVDISSISSYDTYGTLYNAADQTLISSDDDSGDSANFRISVTLNPGDYYLTVAGYNNREVPAFEITSTATPVAPAP